MKRTAPARTRLLGRVNHLRCGQAERALRAACQHERDADATCRGIESQLAAMRTEEAQCARSVAALANLAAMQAAQQRGAQLREQALAQQANLTAARETLQARRLERECSARRLRREQVRAEWLRARALCARMQAQATNALADDESALELGLAGHGRMRED